MEGACQDYQDTGDILFNCSERSCDSRGRVDQGDQGPWNQRDCHDRVRGGRERDASRMEGSSSRRLLKISRGVKVGIF